MISVSQSSPSRVGILGAPYPSPQMNSGERRKRKTPKRQTWSCVPCRDRKSKCNRIIPCECCIRHGCEHLCRLASSTVTLPSPTASHSSPPGTKAPKPLSRPLQSLGSSSILSDNASSTYTLDSIVSPAMRDNPSSHDVSDLADHSVASFAWLRASKVLRSQYSIGSCQTPLEAEMVDDSFRFSRKFVPEYSPSSSSPSTSVLSGAERDEATEWRIKLISILPSQSHCDIMLSFFSDDLNRIYNAIHMPTFRVEYAKFWLTDVRDVDLIWLSLLYAIICTSVLYIPTSLSSAIFRDAEVGVLARKWYSASRQCLYAGGFEGKACLTQLQTFIITQPYWIGTNDMETMNSCLAQAIRAAQTLGLDRDTMVSDSLGREMRHRIWWDICCHDITWSRCLGLQPFIQVYLSEVPIPLNCNDIDMTPTSFTPRVLAEPTETTLNVLRIQFVKIYSRLYVDSGTKESSFDFVMSVDSEILALLDEFPWYFQPNEIAAVVKLPKEYNFIAWQSHLLHTYIHVQRLRMFKPFLQSCRGPALKMSIEAAESALAVYRSLRKSATPLQQLSMKAATHCWQICSTAIALGIFILVERPEGLQNIRSDMELVISDLEELNTAGFKIPCVSEGSKIIRKILAMYDSNGNDITMEPTSLVPEVYTLTGGRTTTQKDLERCAIDFIINADSRPSDISMLQSQNTIEHSGHNIDYSASEPFPSDVDFQDLDFHFDLTQGTGAWDRWTFF